MTNGNQEAVVKALGISNYNNLKISKIEFLYDDPYLTEAPMITCNSEISPVKNTIVTPENHTFSVRKSTFSA